MIPAINDTKNKKYKSLQKITDINEAQKKATDLYGKLGTLYISTNKDKKFMIKNPFTNKFVHFGQMDYQDFTKHKDKERQISYLKRAMNIKGDWEKNIYSPNMLSIHILW
jgi:hypothetical protein